MYTSGITATNKVLVLYTYANTSGQTVNVGYNVAGLTFQKVVCEIDEGPYWSSPYTPLQDVAISHHAVIRREAVPHNYRHDAEVHYIQDSGYELRKKIHNGQETLLDRRRLWDRNQVITQITRAI